MAGRYGLGPSQLEDQRALAIAELRAQDEIDEVAARYADDDDEADVDAEFDDDGPRCAGCGCSMARACPGGCVWATPTRCSRCV